MSEIEEVNPDVPYRAEYAKSARAKCRGCKGGIEKGTLRLAVLVQSPMFDGKMTLWYHFMCFFGKQRPKSVGDIAHFEELTFEDQEKIRKQIAKHGEDASASTSNGSAKIAKKRPKAAVKKDLQNVFLIEYSKSSRATCRGCGEKCVKGEIRVSKKDFESDEGRRFGGMDTWHHLVCFTKMRSELGFYHCGDTLPGFNTLNKEDKATVKKSLPEIKPKVEGSDAVDGDVPAKKVKLEEGDDEEKKKKEKEEKKKLKKQSDEIFKTKAMIADLKKAVLIQILEYNEQEIPVGEDRIRERLADCLTFGKLLPCEKCKTGQYVFRSGVGYQCTGSASEWVKCENISFKPRRAPCKIPEEIVEEFADNKKLAEYKCKVHDRIIQFSEKTVPVKNEEASGSNENGPKLKLDRKLPFKGMVFFINKFGKEKKDMKLSIEKLGGTVSSILIDEIAAVISTEEEVKNCTNKIQDAKDLGIHVVGVDFIEKCKDLDDAVDKIAEYAISPWGDDPKKRIDKYRRDKSAMESMKSGKSKYEKSGKSSKVKYKVESGTAVEPESGLVDTAHVYKAGKDVYTVTLGLTDVQSNRNSFYKLQLLESNASNKKYWLFRAWGRIGTSIGGTKLDSFNSDLSEAKKQFCFYYEDKTGNLWENHKNFQKIPGKMYPLSVDYGESSNSRVENLDASKSKLKKPVQDLIMMIFNIDLMKKTMIEFEINLDEMPLGRISKSQMKQAYLVLTELQNFINQKGEDIKPDQKKLILGATNRFYTLVPHSFGIKAPPLLDNLDIIKQKIEMLDSLLEMEFAYEVMQSNQEGGEHSLDAHYAKLNTDIDVVEPDSKEFEIIKNYVKNTHAETHSSYELQILDAFKVNRKEEEKRYKPFKKLPNRKLLWHGSRLTNFAGILSQGLRIAPPEAPVTGYMFGKGIYFADMVSKSANYCMTSPNNNVGLLLLCEVALGTMYERKQADYIEKLPSGYHSTKGLGVTSPDPEHCVTLDDGLEVPIGKPVKSDKKNSALLYNEYIVYDVAQVKAKYLVKMEFKYKY